MACFARLLFALSTATVVAAAQPRVPGDPSAATFVYDDLDRFTRAVGRIRFGADALTTIEAEYFAPATPGLKALIARKGISATALAADIGKQPAAYADMAQLVERLKRHEPAIQRSFASLAELYPDSVFPPV